MWRILVSSLLVSVAAGQALRLADGYLPPGNTDKLIPNSVRCDDPKTIYRTETQRITNTVVRTVTETVPQLVQKTVVISQTVPSTVVRTSIQQVTSPVVRTRVETSILNRISTSTVNVPGVTRVKTETSQTTQIRYETQQRVVQRTVVVTDTQVQYSTVVDRITQTVTETVQ